VKHKNILSSISGPLALAALLVVPGAARADICTDLDNDEQAVKRKLARLAFDHPVVTAGVAACAKAAQSEPKEDQALTMGLCVIALCLFAGEETCDDVAGRSLNLILEEAAIEIRRDMAHCGDETTPPAIVPPPVTRPAVAPRLSVPGIVIDNKCDHPVEVAVRYADTDGKWSSVGWWPVPAKTTTAHLAASDGSILRTNTAALFFYARTTDGSSHQWYGDHIATLGDQRLRMKGISDANGDTEIVLVCNP